MEYEKEHIYICITDSLCSIAVIINQLCFNKIKKKIKTKTHNEIEVVIQLLSLNNTYGFLYH